MKTDANKREQLKTDVPGSGTGTSSGAGSREDSSEPPPAASEQAAVVPAEEAILLFPTVGKNPRDWPLLPPQIRDWQAAFPGVDVLAECRKAHAWCAANPAKRKTFDGMPRFFVSWLSKAQNERGGRQTGSKLFPSKAERSEAEFEDFVIDAFPEYQP